MRKVHGVGINDADYKVTKYADVDGKYTQVWICPYYSVWKHMLYRCYHPEYHKRQPTYIACTVCPDWLIFSNFKKWMQAQDWEGKQLDKDILVDGNLVYGPEFCVFVEQSINKFLHDVKGRLGSLKLGAHLDARKHKYVAACSNPFEGKREVLGRFDTQHEAHLAWKSRKHELACMLADSDLVTDERVAQALRTRYL